MHLNSIAHLDLKPDNILVDVDSPSCHLWITDFSVSVQIKGEDELIEGHVGTPGWMAPEIGNEDGPPQKYSPIRADRWSCGRMIQYFSTFGPGFKDPDLDRLSQALLDKDPAKRPSLPDPQQLIKKRPVTNPTGHMDQMLSKKRRLPRQDVGRLDKASHQQVKVKPR
jgi:serine/threonine protein kinase